jgi:hypothetical protein
MILYRRDTDVYDIRIFYVKKLLHYIEELGKILFVFKKQKTLLKKVQKQKLTSAN